MIKKMMCCFLLIPLMSLMLSCDTKATRVLVVTGGHDFQEDAFYAMFDSFADITYDIAVQPKANVLYTTGDLDPYDALVFYDMYQEITAEQKAAFLDILKQGKGMVFLHHALVSYQDWDEYEQIIGGRYIEKTDSGQTDASTYQHDVDIPVKVMETSHPVTRGVNDFEIHDEVYGGFRVSETVHPLLSTNHPQSSKMIGWYHIYKNSRIVYIQLGHDHHAYQNPNYQKLVRQAIDWVKASSSVN
ncbi:MAG: ThuA domain-containing protein [candidate division KSB1 bacterium]|nr:ThuA domain-containing protein [candidate division KSB1 bacterium]